MPDTIIGGGFYMVEVFMGDHWCFAGEYTSHDTAINTIKSLFNDPKMIYFDFNTWRISGGGGDEIHVLPWTESHMAHKLSGGFINDFLYR